MLHIWKRKKNVFWGHPVEWSHGEIVVLTLSDSELFLKVRKVVEFMAGIEFFIILPMAAFYLSVVPGCKGADQLMADAELCQGSFEQGGFWILSGV